MKWRDEIMAKQKRFYKVGEVVYIKGEKTFGVIKRLDVNPPANIYKATVEVSRKDNDATHITHVELNLWDIDKDKRELYRKKKYPVGLNKGFFQVRDFHKAFGHPVSDSPVRIDAERALARADWMKEEVQEFLDALTVTDQADAMIDLIYFALGTLVEMGVRPDRLFDIVQEANMGKLHEIDGEMVAVYRADGKILKPSNWRVNFAPEARLKAEIEFQAERAKERANA